jgi:hypothetical protein
MENRSELLIYQTSDGKTKIEVQLQDETVWLSLNQMSELFQKPKSTISEHIKHIYEEGELPEDSTVRNFRTVKFLAFAENQARQKKVMYMSDWIRKLNDILIINENEILEHAGNISRQIADEIALSEYDKYNKKRRILEDEKSFEELDNELKQLNKKKDRRSSDKRADEV